MIGKTVSHYKIIEKLGEGGMGEVFLAQDTTLDRKVALKFLPSHYTSDPQINARFKREAKAAAALNHPNIVTIHEFGEFEDPQQSGKQTFIAMEYVDGQSLRDLNEKNEIPINQVLDIATQLCSGLNEAHKAGVVHRDLKPENILVDKNGLVKILDFGLAKLGGATKLTRESSTLGTLFYMSPEQYQNAEVDHRTDIWSFGVILFEMITGHLPFKGEYDAGMMYSILNDKPDPIERYKSGIPANFQIIVNKALAKNTSERFQNIGDLSADLHNLRTVTSIPSKPAKRKSSFVKKLIL